MSLEEASYYTKDQENEYHSSFFFSYMKCENDPDCNKHSPINVPLDVVKKESIPSEAHSQRFLDDHDLKIQTGQTAAIKEELDVEADYKPGWEPTGSSVAASDSQMQAENVEFKDETGISEDICALPESKDSHEDEKRDGIYEFMEGSHETGIKNNVPLRSKRGRRVYKCDGCPYETKYKSHLTVHNVRKHVKEADVYKCEECPFDTRIEYNLKQHHLRKHMKQTDLYRYKCEECPYEARIKSDLRQHFRGQHVKRDEVYKCEECSYETTRKKYLNEHYKYAHAKGAEVHKCQECSYETRIKSHMTRHRGRKHMK